MWFFFFVGYGAETPTSEPGYCATDMWDSDWDSDPEDFFVYRHQVGTTGGEEIKRSFVVLIGYFFFSVG